MVRTRRSALGHDIISDKEIQRSTTDIIEEMKNTNINIRYTNQPVGYCETHEEGNNTSSNSSDKLGVNNKHTIVIGNIKGLDQMTVVNHELGHIFADSPVQSAKKLIEKWVKDLPDDYQMPAKKTFWGVLNTFEDQRIESWMGNMWLNNKVRFNQARKALGDNMREDNTVDMGKAFKEKEEEDYTPIQVILATRFFQGDMVKGSEMYPMAKELLKQIEYTNNEGAILAMTKFKPYIDEYIRRKIEEAEEKSKEAEDKRKERNERQNELESLVDEKAEEDADYDPDDDSSLNSLRSEINELTNEMDSSNKAMEQMEEQWRAEQKGQSTQNEDSNNAYKESNMVNTEQLDEDTTREAIDKMLEQARKQGEEQLRKMRDKIRLTNDPKAPEYLEADLEGIERGTTDCGLPATEIAKGMNKIFRTLAELPVETVCKEGDEVDVESFVSNKARGFNIDECLIDTKYIEGASILISVDGSCSMDNYGGSMKKARDMTATLFRSIQNVPNINLKAIVWSGSSQGEKMLVTPINSLKETERMTSCSAYCLTPTHLAIDYSVDMIRKMKGRKKLLIFITDGYPQFYKDGHQLDEEELAKLGKKAMTRAIRYCPNIMSMLINDDDHAEKLCRTIFGTRMMVVDDMADGKTVIVRKFKRLVAQVLRR